MAAAVTLAGCGNDGSDSAQTQLTLSLESDAPCYGVRAEIDLAALNGPSGTCEMSEEVAAAGCIADVRTENDVLIADARGCMIDSGALLFDCELSSGNAGAVEAATRVTYGCGCQSACPTDVSVSVQAARGASKTGLASLWGLDTRDRFAGEPAELR